MSVQDPGPITVTCDECGEEIQVDTIEYVAGEGSTFGPDKESVEAHGWYCAHDHSEHLCPDCKNPKKEEQL